MTQPARNIELKIRHPDLAKAEQLAMEMGATFQWSRRQRDTYFAALSGRLKLREFETATGPAAELIAYQRLDAGQARPSDYRVVPVPDPAALTAALAETVGVRGIVAKTRRLLLWRNVRIHLDLVDGLGSFIELEAVVGVEGVDEPTSRANLSYVAGRLDLLTQPPVSGSYIDLTKS